MGPGWWICLQIANWEHLRRRHPGAREMRQCPLRLLLSCSPRPTCILGLFDMFHLTLGELGESINEVPAWPKSSDSLSGSKGNCQSYPAERAWHRIRGRRKFLLELAIACVLNWSLVGNHFFRLKLHSKTKHLRCELLTCQYVLLPTASVSSLSSCLPQLFTSMKE